MGSLFSGFLEAASMKSQNALNVMLRANWKSHRQEIQKNGLVVTPLSDASKSIWDEIRKDCKIGYQNGSFVIPVHAVDDSIFDPSSHSHRKVDEVLLFDKSYNTEMLATMIKGVLSETGTCLTLQNGMGNVEILQRILGKERVLQGNTSQGAMLRNPGEVIHSGTGYITIVSPTPQGQKSAEWWVKTLQSVHLPAELGGSNFEEVLWKKLIVNAVINPLTAIHHCKNGEILSLPEYNAICDQVVNEAVRVAERCGVRLDVADCKARVQLVAEQTAANRSSMASDIAQKRRTEIDFINGYIVAMGRKQGIETPVNCSLTEQVKRIECK